MKHALAGLLLEALLVLPAHAEPSRPNVLVLIADGLDASGGTAIDAIARHGRTFDHAFLPNPLSVPSRAALFFGRRGEAMDIWVGEAGRPKLVKALPELFAQAGYGTIRVGRGIGGPIDGTIAWDETLAAGEDASRVVAAVLARSHTKPFFVTASFDGLGPLLARLPAAGAAVSPQRPAMAFDDQTFLARPGLRESIPAPEAATRLQARAAQQERMRKWDEQLARVVSALDRQKLWTNTIVVVAGTQAPLTLAQGALTRADVLFDESLQVPLVIAAPRAGAPGKSLAEASLLDVYPTLLELAGLSPERTDGKSLVPVVRDAAASVQPSVTSVVWRKGGKLGRSLRTERYRYSEWPDGSQELYDHDKDPQEHANLAAGKDSAAALAEMKTLLGQREQELKSTPSAAPARAAAPTSARPNVLFIIADDMTPHLGAYGFPVKTPNMDRLAAEGRRFEHAYAQAPSCSPSRTSFLSGWRPERADVWANGAPPRRAGMVPLQEHFGANGYFTAQVGKVWETMFAGDFHWDVAEYDPPLPETADSAESGDAPTAGEESPPAAKRPRQRRQRLGPVWWVRSREADEDQPDGRRARRVAQLIEEKRDRPFFIALGLAKPHMRWIAPTRYFDLYDPNQIVPPPPPTDLSGVPAIAIKNMPVERPGVSLAGREPPGLLPDPELRKQALAAYFATLTFVDAQVGVVLDALDRSPQRDHTIVVLIGDHGYHLGDHGGLWRKDTLFEEALHVPLIIRAPGLAKPGTATQAVAELLDLYPTFVDLAGLPRPAGLDGKSLVPVLQDPAATVRTSALSLRLVPPPTLGVSVRSGRFRYTQWPDGSEELYDVEKDKDERDNLVEQPDRAAVLEEMRARRAEQAP